MGHPHQHHPGQPPRRAQLADQITLAQAQLDSLAATAGSAPFVTPWDEELAKAEAVGDYDKALNMKGAQLGQMFRP